MRTRKITIAVRHWSSEEGIHTWKYCKQHVLQPKDGTPWNDQLTLVHVAGGKPGKGEGRQGRPDREREKEREAWDSGGPTIPDVATAVQPYNCAIQQLEGDPAGALVDYVNREGMDILVLASRGRGAVTKAMMGSTTEHVMSRAACACLVVKPQVGAGDTYRMKSAASTSGAPAGGGGALASPGGVVPAPRSPLASPHFGGGRGPAPPGSSMTTPFNRRVAIAYDTTASGRFADKASVQRLAGDALSGLPHITTFNLGQAGNARRAVLDFVAKESVDLLVIGMYKGACKRKGLGRRGNATVVYNRCACPVLVVPMSEAALVVAVKAAELEAAAAEEEELASDSESDSSEAGEAEDADNESPNRVLSHPRAIMGSIADAFNFKRRHSGQNEPSTAAAAAAAAGHSPPLASRGALAGLSAGRYVVEVDGIGGIRSINPLQQAAGSAPSDAPEFAAALDEPGGFRGPSSSGPSGSGPSAGGARSASVGGAVGGGRVSASGGSAGGGGGADLHVQVLRQQKEITELRAQLARLSAGPAVDTTAATAEAAAGAGAEQLAEAAL
ncbi:hypothetical protein Rsub_01542 [Raphidocelis subcapitata]|uniref:UspA domain-containing protein n=1 Tax=Raphidocelis subcapitata TaxID=307507 RepID=A0A2V0NSX6_9CHLO|nr:hypothetical protein Rsub_01542 [Raphidocelis subcapitata]|eukprot:GBF88643.1 hypothetical protein Rsub_01542 [Raphidocelis subcapitata]